MMIIEYQILQRMIDRYMLYTIDRVQYANQNNQYYFYEFMEVSNIHSLIGENGKLPCQNEFWNTLTGLINDVEKNKLEFIKGNINAIKIFIFYQSNIDIYIKIEINPFTNIVNGHIWNFDNLQNWFRQLNNIDGNGNSKELGAARDTDFDSYVNGILKNLYNNSLFHDDNGLHLTKSLLNGDTTKGFDLDLFQYIPSTNEYIIYEFLRRENQYINNIQAHPMRYCWTGKWNDNKQKFISLWNIKQYLNARLILVNYSDNPSEKISLIEVLNLDINNGITSENKYCISRNVFSGWLHDMQNYSSNNPDYLSEFKYLHYNQEFFENFGEDKKKYGAEFTNIYI